MTRSISYRNKYPKNAAWLLSLLSWPVLLLSACSGLAGEPPIVATLPPRPVTVDVGLPTNPPDIVQGARIYAENCVRCHGPGGQGNGELVLSGQITTSPRDFTDPTTTRSQSPGEWFTTITDGRLENLMPPWGNSLSEADRWSVALYTYTLSYLRDQVQQGEAVWSANCAECHGETGAGNGPRAADLAAPISNLAQPDTLVALGDAAIFETVSQGKGDAMPAFADTLDEQQIWAVTAYTRTLSLANTGAFGQAAPPPASTAEVEVASAVEVPGSISGQVRNATAGGEIPFDLNVRLHIFDSQLNEQTLETTVTSDGRFSFSDVPIRSDRAYLVTAAYQGRDFSSDVIAGNISNPVLDLPVTIYESTEDPTVITVSGLVTQITDARDSLQVAQIVSFRNTSDRLYVQKRDVDGARAGSIRWSLPRGAQILNTGGDAQRYIMAEDGRTLIDTRPVFPGDEHLVHVIYTLPYNGNANIQLPLNYALEGNVQLLIRPDSLRVISEQLSPLGTQTMGRTPFQTYAATLSLATGDVLDISVTGSPVSQSAAVPTPNLLAYALIAIGSLSLLIAAALYYLGRRMPAAMSNQQLSDVLIEQITELDDLYAQGKIEAGAYEERRAKLKTRLAKLLDKQ